MKKCITVEQLRELNSGQINKLCEWWKPQRGDFFITNIDHEKPFVDLVKSTFDSPMSGVWGSGMHNCYGKDNCLPLFSLTQILEFIGDHINVFKEFTNLDFFEAFMEGVEEGQKSKAGELEIIDYFWEMVKRRLAVQQ